MTETVVPRAGGAWSSRGLLGPCVMGGTLTCGTLGSKGTPLIFGPPAMGPLTTGAPPVRPGFFTRTNADEKRSLAGLKSKLLLTVFPYA